jgi:putative transposase
LIFDKINHQFEETSNSDLFSNTNKTLYWKPESLGVIINQYKGACTIKSRKINPNFAWQSRFYEHVIRNEEDLFSISEYIIYNPQTWEKDDYF